MAWCMLRSRKIRALAAVAMAVVVAMAAAQGMVVADMAAVGTGSLYISSRTTAARERVEHWRRVLLEA